MRFTLLLLSMAALHAAEFRAVVSTEPATLVRADGTNAVFAVSGKGAARCAPNSTFRPVDLTDRK